MSKITLDFELDDVEGLWHTSTRSFYYSQMDRFENLKNVPATFLVEYADGKLESDKRSYMYWLQGYASVLLFTKVLNAFGYSTAVLNDLALEGVDEYVVLTDYAGNWDSEPSERLATGEENDQ
jgi:hypothetical protein